MTVADRMKKRRISLNMSADDVAKELGVSRSTIFRYENGSIEKVPSDLLEQLASALKTTPSFLMGWEDEDDSYTVQLIQESISLLNTENKKSVMKFIEYKLEQQEEEEPLSPNEYELPVAHIKNDSINMPMWMDDVTDDFIAVSKIVVNYAKMLGNFHFSGGFDIQEMTDEMLVDRANNLLQKQEFVERLENQKLIKKGNNYYVQLQQEIKGSN